MSDSGAAASATAPAPAAASTPAPATTKPAAEQTTTEKVVETVKRYIPGLAKQPDAPAAPSKPAAKRSRSTKSKKAVLAGADDPALATATLAEAPEKSELPESLTVPSGNRPAPLSVNGGENGPAGLTEEELAALQHKRFSPVLSVQKKIRANNKKLQRVAAYEAETGQLNADQKKVVASKPALEAVQRELNDLVKVFETEEAEDEKRVAKKQQYEEKQVQLRINQALSNSKVSSQNDLTLLLQFLHLYSLFNPSDSSISHTVPPVVANATNEQTAAVHTLFNNLANGPLFGASADGSSDAVSQIKSLQGGSDKSIIEGVSFADVKQMIFDLTAPPAEVGHEIPEEEAHPNGLSMNGHDSSSLQMPSVTEQPPLAGASAAPALNFMQASELQEGETASINNDAPEHQRALESISASATPGFGSGTPVVEQPEPALASGHQESAPVASGWNADSTQLVAGSVPAPAGTAAWDDVNASEPIQNWADEVDEHPSNPFTATAEVPAELEGQNKEATEAVPVGGEAPGVAAIAGAGTDGRGRGRGRGGRGRGEGRGRGRGGFRGEGGQWRNQETNGGAPASAVQQALSAAGDGFTDVNRRGNRGGTGGEGRGGSFRGGRGRGDGSRGDYRGGRGRGEGRGRGGPRSGPNTPTTAGAPAVAPSAAA